MNPSPAFMVIAERNAASTRERRATRIAAVRANPTVLQRLIARAVRLNSDDWALAIAVAVEHSDDTSLRMMVDAVLVDDSKEMVP